MMREPDNKQSGLLILAGLAAVLTAVVLIAVKLVAWLLTGSVSLLASLIDSLMDSLASLINLLAIRYSLIPADTEHRFGHGKAEALAGLGQAVLITGSAGYLIYESTSKLLNPEPLTATGLGIAVMLFSTVVTIGLVALQRYVIRRTSSTAIEADSLHYVTDVAVNISVVLALVAAHYGQHWVDGAVALAVAFYILSAALRIAWNSIQLLMDREVSEDVRTGITAIVARHPDVLGFHDLRTRQSGRTRFIQLHVDMDENLPLREAHALGEEVEREIMASFADVDVIIHLDPVVVVQRDEWAERGQGIPE